MSSKTYVKPAAKTSPTHAPTIAPQSMPAPAQTADMPDPATQLANAVRFGHNFGAVAVRAALPVIQPKLMLGPAHDRYEAEADRAAGQVMRLPYADLPREPAPPIEDEHDRPVPVVQRTGQGDGFAVDAEIEGRLAASRGSGIALPAVTRAFMEPRFGADFSRVRIHADAEADRLNQALQARAFTTGPDIYFRRGAYSPGSAGGRQLIAHELAHVVQQAGGGQAQPGVGAAHSIRPQAASIQRQSLAQAQLANNLTLLPETMPLKGQSDQRHVQIYRFTVASPVRGGQVDALVIAAKVSGVIGRRIFGTQFTQPNHALNHPANPAIDPFILEVVVPYEEINRQADTLTLRFQHAREWTGYVVALRDSINRDTHMQPTMYQNRPVAITDLYSNRHDTRDRQNVSQLLVGGGQERNYDAYTKIAGEASRWLCVARHAHFINDDSRFFTRTGTHWGVKFVTFETLWKNWASQFGKAYLIEDNVVADRIDTPLNGGHNAEGRLTWFVGDGDVRDMTSKDYDLDNHRSNLPQPDLPQ